MVRMGNVWDRTVAVLGNRGGTLGGVAVIAFILPAVVQALATAFASTGAGAALLAAAVSLLVVVVNLWGQLALIGLALDPATSRAAATRAATARLPAALLVGLVLLAGILLLAAPVWVALAAGGFDFAAAAAAQRTGVMPAMPAGVGGFIGLYLLVLTIVLLWLLARLFVAMPVVLSERRAVGALGRSFRLTRGLALRIIGVLILYLIVVGVATLAIQSIVGIAFRLLFSEGRMALLLTAIVVAAVTTLFTVIASVFTAQFYAALRGREAEHAPTA